MSRDQASFSFRAGDSGELATEVTVSCRVHPAPHKTSAWGLDTDLEDLLDAIDGGGQQGVHLEVIVHVVRVPDAHVEDVGREAGHRACQCLWFQLCQQQTAMLSSAADAA